MIDTTMPGPGPIEGMIPPYFVYTLLTVFAIVLVFYWLIRRTAKRETALEILKKRFAGGEVDLETYRRMKKDLEE